jgi:hypothetical protein
VRDVRGWLLGVCCYRVSVEWRVIVKRHRHGYVAVCNMTEVHIVILLVCEEPVMVQLQVQ